MSTRVEANARFKMQLPQDCYGTPDLARFVRGFKSVRGSAQRDSAASFLLTADSSGAVSIEYTLAYDQAELDRSAFAPNVGPGHFHVAGCQWLLIPEHRDQVRRHVITLNTGGERWHFYSSLREDPARIDTTASYRMLIATALGSAELYKAPLPEDSLFAIGARHGLGLESDFQRYVIQGGEIAIDDRSLGEGCQLVRSSIPNPLDVGFALGGSRAAGLVQGVVPGGAAAAAGLRDGMPLVRLENDNPLSPVWRVDQPVRVTVGLGGRDSTVALAPRGAPVTVSLFRATTRAPRRPTDPRNQ
jgi:predicted metalloprotease with PDZ domain